MDIILYMHSSGVSQGSEERDYADLLPFPLSPQWLPLYGGFLFQLLAAPIVSNPKLFIPQSPKLLLSV